MCIRHKQAQIRNKRYTIKEEVKKKREQVGIKNQLGLPYNATLEMVEVGNETKHFMCETNIDFDPPYKLRKKNKQSLQRGRWYDNSVEARYRQKVEK